MDLKDKFEYYLEALSHCGSFLKYCTEDEIEHELFEEFDSDSVSFLHKRTIEPLLKEGLINEEIYKKSLLLREKFRKMEHTRYWNSKSVKINRRWEEILLLADEIKEKLEIYSKEKI